jgi:hypothetical protein
MTFWGHPGHPTMEDTGTGLAMLYAAGQTAALGGRTFCAATHECDESTRLRHRDEYCIAGETRTPIHLLFGAGKLLIL